MCWRCVATPFFRVEVYRMTTYDDGDRIFVRNFGKTAHFQMSSELQHKTKLIIGTRTVGVCRMHTKNISLSRSYFSQQCTCIFTSTVYCKESSCSSFAFPVAKLLDSCIYEEITVSHISSKTKGWSGYWHLLPFSLILLSLLLLDYFCYSLFYYNLYLRTV